MLRGLSVCRTIGTDLYCLLFDMSDAWNKPDPKVKRNLDWKTRVEAPEPDFSAFAAASPSATRPPGRTDDRQQEDKRTPKPGDSESDSSAPPSTEKHKSMAANLLAILADAPSLPQLPMPLQPVVGGATVPPGTTVAQASEASNLAPPPPPLVGANHAVLGLPPSLSRGSRSTTSRT